MISSRLNQGGIEQVAGVLFRAGSCINNKHSLNNALHNKLYRQQGALCSSLAFQFKIITNS